MKTLLICHDGAQLETEVLSRWLSSFSNLVGMVIIQEPQNRLWHRVRREIHRIGIFRFIDVLAFRLYYRLFLARKDREWERRQVEQNRIHQGEISRDIEILKTPSPNAPQAQEFIERLNPDIVLARCKVILKESVFSIPAKGTLVMHPGICPEYRNAHGCFWALARRDLGRVGMTLLRVDRGIDTGPVFGYYTYAFDEVHESHSVIQSRVVLENLDVLREKFVQIFQGTATPLDTAGRSSNEWGQPRLTDYLRWKSQARRVHR